MRFTPAQLRYIATRQMWERYYSEVFPLPGERIIDRQ